MSTTKKYVSLSKLQTFLDNLKDKFAALKHSHTINEIVDYTVDGALSSTSTNPVQNNVLDAEFEAVSRAMTALELAIDKKVDTSSMSNYYTKTESNEYTDNAVLQKSQVQIITWGADD